MSAALPVLNTPGRRLLTVALLAAAAVIAGLFTLPVLDRDEARYAQASAQMLETGDPVRIRFQDEPRLKKPAGIYWLQAASVGIFSDAETRAIWAYRLPSLAGAVLAALAAAAAAGALLGARAGFAAGALFAVSVMLATEGGIAKTDAVLTAACALAFLSLVKVRLASQDPSNAGARPKLWAVIGWAAVAAGVLVKGPVAPLAMGLAVITLSVWERRIDWWRHFLFWPGPVLAALILLPWFAAIWIESGASLADAFGADIGPKIVSGHEGHGAPPGSHTLLLPVLFFPAILFLPAGIAAAVTALRGRTREALAARLALAWAVPFFVLFELMPTKLPHYTLPAQIGLAVLAGWGFAALGRRRAVWRGLGSGLMILGALVPGAMMVAVATRFDGPVASSGGLAVLLIAVTLAAGIEAIRARPERALALALAAGLVFHIGARGLVIPASDELFLARKVMNTVEARGFLEGEPAIWSTYTEPSLVFALEGRPHLVEAGELPAPLTDTRSPVLVILDENRLGADMSDPRLRLEAAACARDAVSGFNYSRGDPTSVVIYRLGECHENEDEP